MDGTVDTRNLSYVFPQLWIRDHLKIPMASNYCPLIVDSLIPELYDLMQKTSVLLGLFALHVNHVSERSKSSRVVLPIRHATRTVETSDPFYSDPPFFRD